MSLLQEALNACAALTRRIEHLELKRVGTSQRIDTSKDTVMDDASNQGRIIDEIDKDNVVDLMDDKEEDKNEEEAKVVEDDQVVTAASETITAVSIIISAAEPQVTAATITVAPVRVVAASTRRRKGVVIRDLEEESTTSSVIPANTKSKYKGKGIIVEELKPLKKKQQVEMDEEYARKLHVELNKDIDWDVAIEHVKKEVVTAASTLVSAASTIIPAAEPKVPTAAPVKVAAASTRQRRGVVIRDPEDESSAKTKSKDKGKGKMVEEPKPMKKKQQEQIEEEENMALQSINVTPAQKAAKRRKMNEDLKQHLEIMLDEDDDVYTKATPLARKVPVVDYQIIQDPEDESSAKTKSKDKGKGKMVEEPKPMKKKQQVEMDEAYARKLHEELNQGIDWDVAIEHVKQKAKEDPFVQRHQVMKKRPQTKAQARRNMIMYLKNTAGFKLDYFKGMSYDDIRPIFEAKFNTNMKFLLNSKEQIEEEENRALQIERRYPLSKFTLDQMLNTVRLQVKEQSEMSLELLSLKKNTKCFNAAREEPSAVKHKLMLLDTAAEGRVNTAKQAEIQAEIYQINMDHAAKVLSMQKEEPKVQEVVEVVTTAKLITEVVTAASALVSIASTIIPAVEPNIPVVTITAAPVNSKDKGKGIMVEEIKPMKKKQQVEIDEAYARKLHKELNQDIDWDVAIEHAKFNANMKFLMNSNEQIEEEENRALESINETSAQKAAKQRSFRVDVTKELKEKHKCFNVAGEELSAVKHKLMLLDTTVEGRVNTTKMEAIRIFFTFATYMKFNVFQMDVKSAFLNGKLKEEVCVKQPPGFESSEFPKLRLYIMQYGQENHFRCMSIAWRQVSIKKLQSVAMSSAEAEYVVAVYLIDGSFMGLEYGRYGVSKVLDTAYWGFLGVRTMFDIFQNILFLYSLNTAYFFLLDTAYWILFPSWSLNVLIDPKGHLPVQLSSQSKGKDSEVQAQIRRIFLDGYGILYNNEQFSSM
nr:retrovirus-related Pol polyprotein from transposon TNT 1-94 [Tanacetum cinerariifolium]